MTRTRLAQSMWAVLSLAALLALVIGVPVLLASNVGWPLPATMPRLDAVREALTGQSPIDSFVWFAVLACIAWMMWVRVSLAIAVEIIAAVRQRPAPARAGVHAAIGPMIAAIVMAVSASVSRPHPALP